MDEQPKQMKVLVEGGEQTRNVAYYEAPSVRMTNGKMFRGAMVAIPVHDEERERIVHLLDGRVFIERLLK